MVVFSFLIYFLLLQSFFLLCDIWKHTLIFFCILYIVFWISTCYASFCINVIHYLPKIRGLGLFLSKSFFAYYCKIRSLFYYLSLPEAPVLWPPNVKSRLIGKDPEAGKDWRQTEKAVTEMKWWDSITDSMETNLSKLWKIVKDEEASHAAVHGLQRVGHNSVTEEH